MKFKEKYLYDSSFELYLEIHDLINSIKILEPIFKDNVKSAFLDIAIKASVCDNRLDFNQFYENIYKVQSATNRCIIYLDVITRQTGIAFQKQMSILEEIALEVDEILFREMTVEEMNEICEKATEEYEAEKKSTI